MAEKELVKMYRVVDANKDLKHDAQINHPKKTPEEKQYLLCIAGKDGADDEWEIITGRTATYERIKESIEYIDFELSFVLVETLTLSDRKSIYAFMKYVQDFYNDGFDIEDYIKGDWSESDYKASNNIDPSIDFNSDRRINMQSIMDGGVETTSLE